MKEAGEQFGRMAANHVSSQAPAVPFFSCQSNEIIQRKNALNAAYWQSSYDNPVLFHTALEKLLATPPSDNPLMLLEIGPHSALAGPIRQILKAYESNAFYIPTLVRYENDTHSMLTAAGQMFLKGLRLDFQALNPVGHALANLPNYPWHHQTRYWHESRLSKQWRLRSFPHHDLLGSRIPESSDVEPTWRNVLRLDDVPWCRDHLIAGNIVFPGAGYVAMAGEAIRQVSGLENHDYTLNDLSLRAAMTLHESTAIEILFTMRPFQLTTNLDSAWSEFTVTSYNEASSTWTKHCAGRVKAGAEFSVEPRTVIDLPRKVHSASWYRLMRKVGMSYGARFQGLEDITAHPVHYSAVAHVSDKIDEADSIYQFHPTTMDSCIQLFTAAACRGQARSFSNMPFVPTRFGEIYVKRPKAKVTVHVDAEFGTKGDINGSCFGMAADEPVLLMKNVKLQPLGDGSSSRDENPHAGVCVQWEPDIDFQDIRTLIEPSTSRSPQVFHALHRLVLVCSIEARNRLTGLCAATEHMSTFFTWLSAEISRSEDSEYVVSDDVDELSNMSSRERVDLITETAARLQGTKVAAVGTAVCRVFDAIEGIYCSEIDPHELLTKDGILAEISLLTDNLQNCRKFLQLLSHSKPHIRILEIGAGTEATIESVLDNLTSEYGERMFCSYTYTNSNTNVLNTAKEKYQNHQGLEFLPLDIRQSPAKQGIMPGSFDLVIATNVGTLALVFRNSRARLLM